MQGVVERALVLHPARRGRSQVRCCMFKLNARERGSRRPMEPRSSCWPGRAVRREGGVPARRRPYAPDQRGRPEAAGAGAGEGAAPEGRTVRPRAEATAAALRLHRRPGDQPRWRGAARRRHGHPETLALRPHPGGRSPGSGRRRGRGAGARPPAGQPDPWPRSLHRGPGRRRARGPRRIQQRGGVPGSRRRAGAHHLRGRARDRHLADRSRGRPSRRHSVRCGRAGGGRPARRAAAGGRSLGASGIGAHRPHPAGGRAAGPHRRPAAWPGSEPCSTPGGI